MKLEIATCMAMHEKLISALVNVYCSTIAFLCLQLSKEVQHCSNTNCSKKLACCWLLQKRLLTASQVAQKHMRL